MTRKAFLNVRLEVSGSLVLVIFSNLNMKYISFFTFFIVIQILNVSLAIAGGTSMPPYSQKNEEMTFAFWPDSSPTAMQKRYAGLVQLLRKELDTEVYFKTRSNYSEYMESIEKGEFDIAVVNAFDYVKLKNKTQYIPALMRSDELVATFVTNDKNINDIKDLRRKKIGFASEYTSVAISSRYLLIKNGVLSSDYTSVFYNGHISCLQAVVNKSVDVCVTGTLIYQKFSPIKKSNLRVIAKGESMPQLVVLVHPRLKNRLNAIIKLFLDLDKTKSGRAILDETYLVILEEFSGEKYHLCEIILDYISSHDFNE